MQIEVLPLDALHVDPSNVRRHPARNLDAIKASLARFGLQKPIVIDANNVVRAGNGTLEAARALGWETIDCVRTPLRGVEAVGYAIADNRSAELAEWEDAGLAEVLRGLQSEPDFDLAAVGFTDDEVSELLDSLADDAAGADEAPEPQTERAEELREEWGTERGQLWVIPSRATPGGEHRLLCGDSTNAEDVARLMAGGRAAAVVSDPPYGIGYDYDTHDDSRSEWFGLMNRVVPVMRSLAPFVIIPSCGINRMDWWYANHRPDWLMCWYKGSPGHNSHVGFNDWEPHLVWGKPARPIHDYWQTECGFQHDGHPCPKPVAYAVWLVERVADPNQVVCDLFCGSGTTFCAAELTGRLCRGLEIAPKYVAVALERLAGMGLEPRLA